MDLGEAFNMLAQLARANKMTYAEHERATVAIETVLAALNRDPVIRETRHLDAQENEQKKEEKKEEKTRILKKSSFNKTTAQ